MRWTVSAHSRPSGQWRFQDRFFHGPTPQGHLLAALDGHGHGTCTIDRCLELLPRFLSTFDRAGDEALRVRQIVASLVAETKDCGDGSSLAVAHVGDSGDVVVGALGDTAALWGTLTAETCRFEWIRPHDLFTNAFERKRLADAGVMTYNGYLSCKDGSVSTSRGLGDAMCDEVLSREPVVRAFRLHPGSFVVLATDGILDLGRSEWPWIQHCLEARMDAERMLTARYLPVTWRGDDATVVAAYGDE